MPAGTRDRWEHPEAFQFGSSGHGDSGAIAFLLCPVCGHDYMDLNINVPENPAIN